MFNLFKKAKTPFLPLYQEITSKIRNKQILTPEGNNFANSTGNNYNTSIGRYSQFEKKHGTIYLEDIDPAWAEKFTLFLMQEGYAKNSIGVTLGRTKAVLRRLYNEGKSTYHGQGIRSSSEMVTTVYSTIEDIRQLLNFDFSETPGLERVRDIYVMQCFVGLRFSDMLFVLKNPKHFIREIGGSLFFDIKTIKTGEQVVIPLADVVKNILDKYAYDFGDLFTYQYYNLSIKNIAEKAGITGEIVFSRTEGGKRVDTPYPKYLLMSSHTARRTFATNAFLAGMPEKTIMMITGHKTTASFYRYIRCSSLDAAIKIATHNFFKIDLPITKTIKNADVPEYLYLQNGETGIGQADSTTS